MNRLLRPRDVQRKYRLPAFFPLLLAAGLIFSCQRPAAPAAPVDLTISMIRIEAGFFRMGSDSGDFDEVPVHYVRISQAFEMGKYEVTVAQFRQFAEDTHYVTTAEQYHADHTWRDPGFSQTDMEPVVCVSFVDAAEFCNWLSAANGMTPAYTVNGTDVVWDHAADGFRLPTEAEWEYAAKGGPNVTISGSTVTGTRYAGSENIDEVAWYKNNAGLRTHPVGMKRPNVLGLFDMTGNVSELCWDFIDTYPSADQTDSSGPATGEDRALRGGSWFLGNNEDRVTYRNWTRPIDPLIDAGFRVVKNLPAGNA